jgi:PAS domain S-box-containing protein
LDTPLRHHGDDAAHAKLRLYETVLRGVPDLLYVFDLQHRFIYANEALLAMWGLDWEQARGRTCLELGYEPWHAAMHDEEIDRVIATREPIRNEVPFHHSTLGWRIYDYIFMPVIGPDGDVEAVTGSTRDVTERRRHEADLQRSEQRLSAIVNASSDLIYRLSPEWEEIEVIGGHAVTDLPRGTPMAWSPDRIHPEDRQRALDAMQRARETLEPYQSQHRVALRSGEWTWIESRAVPVRAEDGSISEWFGAATDVTQRVQHEEHLRLMVDELNHRVKNTLAIVQALVTQTLRTCSEPAQATAMVESRLHTLAATHDMLTREMWTGAPIDEIVRVALARCHDGRRQQADVQGPDVTLDPKRAVALSMALNELCSNASRFGAFSSPGGRVRIHWTVAQEPSGPLLRLDWEETGGPPVAPPSRTGFGTRLLQRGLQHDLGGPVRLEFHPEGVRCRVEAPLSSMQDVP